MTEDAVGGTDIRARRALQSLARLAVTKGRMVAPAGRSLLRQHRPLKRLPQVAEAYRWIDRSSALFESITLAPVPPAVVLLLPSVRVDALSAGPMTALHLAAGLASRLGRPLEVIATDAFGVGAPADIQALKARLGAPRMRVTSVSSRGKVTLSPRSVFVATQWTTAYACLVAVRAGVLTAKQVVYLVQDFEPAFSPWSTAWAAAEATYAAGFDNVVNSAPLAQFLKDRYGTAVVRDDSVLEPHLDEAQLRRVAATRTMSQDGMDNQVDVFFYARPKVPRNLYPIGLAAAQIATSYTKRPWRLVLAGQAIRNAPSITGVEVQSLGRLDTNGYYAVMERCPVALSLMMSPHPSHPPLDWATSGGLVITNRFEGYRDDLHSRIRAVAADPECLGQGLAAAIDECAVGSFEPCEPLGFPLAVVLDSLSERLSAHES